MKFHSLPRISLSFKAPLRPQGSSHLPQGFPSQLLWPCTVPSLEFLEVRYEHRHVHMSTYTYTCPSAVPGSPRASSDPQPAPSLYSSIVSFASPSQEPKCLDILLSHHHSTARASKPHCSQAQAGLTQYTSSLGISQCVSGHTFMASVPGSLLS